MRWCLEPGRARSVGFGPVFDRRPRHEWKRNRQCSATSQSGRQGAAVPAAKRASGPRPRLPARPEAVASNSCQNRNPVPWAAFPTECRSGAQTEFPPEPLDHPAAFVRDTSLGEAWAVATVGRSAPTTRHRESIYPFPLRKKTAQRLTKFSPCEQGGSFFLLAVLRQKSAATSLTCKHLRSHQLSARRFWSIYSTTISLNNLSSLEPMFFYSLGRRHVFLVGKGSSSILSQTERRLAYTHPPHSEQRLKIGFGRTTASYQNHQA